MKHVNHSPALIAAIDLLLSEAPAGLSEYELMEALDKRYPELFPKPDLPPVFIPLTIVNFRLQA